MSPYLHAIPWIVYFSSLILSIRKCNKPYVNGEAKNLTMPSMGMLALAYAWYNILIFIRLDFEKTNLSVQDYLRNSNVFVNAYEAVTKTSWQWYWSWQILGWTIAIMLRIWEQGLDSSPQPLPMSSLDKISLLWTGFFGAMSTCGGFLFGRITEKSKRDVLVPWHVTLSVILAMISVYINPFIPHESQLFTLNLAFLHLILLFPILVQYFNPTWSRTNSGIKISFLYGLIAIGNMMFHVNIWQNLPKSDNGTFSFRLGLRWTLPKDLILSPFVNPAQTSITADVLFAILITWKYWINEEMEMGKFWLWCLATIWCGIPAMTPMFWMMCRNDTENAYIEQEKQQGDKKVN